MLRFFENLIDPFCDYPPNDTPPQKVWPYLRDQRRLEPPHLNWSTAMFSKWRTENGKQVPETDDNVEINEHTARFAALMKRAGD